MIAEAPLPLRVGTREGARVLCSALERAGFTERRVCEELGLSTLEGVGTPLFKSLSDRANGKGPLEPLARLFLFGEVVPAASMQAHFTEQELDAFFASDLLRHWNAPASDQLYSPVQLVPVKVRQRPSDLMLVGDRGDHPDGSRFTPFADIVFPGHNPLTREFVRLLPASRCGSVLDLCAGTAVGALSEATVADRCTAADIAKRSVHFGLFNGWLNQCDSLEVLCGDLYEPVSGRRFDRIVAHPPYVPALAEELTYRDGGQTGDVIVRRVVEGVPRHLNEGGTFHLVCLGMDTGDGPFEQRARQWLGESEHEFDVVFALDTRTPPELVALRLVDRSGGSLQDLNQWRTLFTGARVQQFVYGALAGRRFPRSPGSEAFTRRVLLTEDCTGDDFDRLFRWFDWLRLPDRHGRVMAAAPRMPPDLRLEVKHQVENDTFVPVGYALTNGGRPFFARMETEAWVAALVSEFNGSRTVRDVFQAAVARKRIPEGFTETELVRMLCFLGERHCLDFGVV